MIARRPSVLVGTTLAAALMLSATADPGGEIAGARPVSPVVDVRDRSLPLSFEPNVGQFAADVRFLARGRGCRLALTSDGNLRFVGADTAKVGGRADLRMSFVGRPPSRLSRG